jgi:hypothetical protein
MNPASPSFLFFTSSIKQNYPKQMDKGIRSYKRPLALLMKHLTNEASSR